MKTVIIYNPNSTGDSARNARSLARELKKSGVEVTLKKTTHAGHGEEIAAEMARAREKALLISASGDGGYHEIVNGALSYPASKLIVGVLPSGNANDHYSAIGSGKLAQNIIKQRFRHIDSIKVSARIGGKQWVRYAHSYVGLGVTASAAKRLTDERPSLFSEKWIVVHSLLSFRYIKLKHAREVHRYSSVLFANINRMSKVIKLSDKPRVDDGRFEMTAIRFRSKLRLLGYLVTAATIGLKRVQSLKRYSCKALSPTPIQLDGEVFVIDAGSTIKVQSIHKGLHCVL